MLAVEPDVGAAELKRVHRALQKQFHPDVREAGEVSLGRLLNEAYATLSNDQV